MEEHKGHEYGARVPKAMQDLIVSRKLYQDMASIKLVPGTYSRLVDRFTLGSINSISHNPLHS